MIDTNLLPVTEADYARARLCESELFFQQPAKTRLVILAEHFAAHRIAATPALSGDVEERARGLLADACGVSVDKLRDRFETLTVGSALTAIIAALSSGARPQVVGQKLWLWANFTSGPEYWAFDNAYPTEDSGEPLTLGSPVGWAIFKPSVNGRPQVPEEVVIGEATRAAKALTQSGDARLREDVEELRRLREALRRISSGRSSVTECAVIARQALSSTAAPSPVVEKASDNAVDAPMTSGFVAPIVENKGGIAPGHGNTPAEAWFIVESQLQYVEEAISGQYGGRLQGLRTTIEHARWASGQAQGAVDREAIDRILRQFYPALGTDGARYIVPRQIRAPLAGAILKLIEGAR